MKKLIALTSFRYDVALVPDMLKNIDGFIDGYIHHDDRQRKSKWYNEGEVRNKLIEEARGQGADWVLCIDPDERFEKSAGRKIRRLIENDNQKAVYGFRLRELWTPNRYRSDGIWDKKIQWRLFPLHDGQTFTNTPVHSPWHPQNEEYSLIKTDINLYHLKNIEPENRTARKELYNSLDPNRKYQKIGYDYLDDETGLETTRIPLGRGYRPKYKEDYKLRQFG